MAEHLALEVITPSKTIFKGSVTSMVLAGKGGRFEVLPEHAHTVAVLDIGLARLELGGGLHYSIAIHGGIARIDPEGVSILANEAERPHEIDIERARSALKRAHDSIGTDKTRLSQVDLVIQDKLRAEARIGAFQTLPDKGATKKGEEDGR